MKETPMATKAIRTIALPAGEAIPVLGQGTRHMGEDPRRHEEEIAAQGRAFPPQAGPRPLEML
jgi:hypothetical protein